MDKSGKITKTELANWMSRHGRVMEGHEIDNMIKAFDDDGDGEIDYNEFLLMVCRRILREKATEVNIDLFMPPKKEKSLFTGKFFM